MVDWARHYDRIYERLGVPAVLTTAGTDGDDYDLTVIDKTTTFDAGEGYELQNVRPVEVQSIRAACDVRMAELAEREIARAAVDGATITFNGASWKVDHHGLRPSPAGEQNGEMRLFLREANGSA